MSNTVKQEIPMEVETNVSRRPARRQRENGQGMVEYALILVLIAVVVVIVLTTVGHQVENVFSNVSHGLAT